MAIDEEALNAELTQIQDDLLILDGRVDNLTDTLSTGLSQINSLSGEMTALATTVDSNHDGLTLLIQEINARIDSHAVTILAQGTSISEAKAGVVTARAEVTTARSDLTVLIDGRIQALRDEFFDLIENMAINLRGITGDDTNSTVGSAVAGLETSWQDKLDAMQRAQDEALAFYQEMNDWIHQTVDLDLPQIRADLDEALADTEALEDTYTSEVAQARQEVIELAQRWRGMADQIDEMRDAILTMDYSAYEDRDELVRTVSAEFEDRFANYDERINVAAGTAGAVATQIQDLNVTVGEQAAINQNLAQAIIDGNDQLSQQITALNVGAQTQFDTAKIWHFDTSNEGWAGLWIDGWLKPGDSTISQALNIDANKYRQVKLRLKRVGTPTWAGSLNWIGALPAGPVSLDEPDWAADYAEITVNPEWTGVLTQLSLVLSSDADADNYFLLDWITVGRPAPGASTAALQEEKEARISQDAASSVRIDTLDAALNSANGLIAGQASAISGLTTRVTNTETGMVSLSEDMTLLENEITNLQTGITSGATALEALRSTVEDQGDTITAHSGKFVTLESNIGNFTATAFDALQTTVTQQGSSLTSQAAKITALETSVPGLATNTALEGLRSTVTQQGNDLTLANSKITALESSLPGKASATAVTALTTRVTQAENSLTLQSQDITALQNQIPGLATVTAIDLMKTDIQKNGNDISINAGKITNLQTNLGTKASSSALDALTTRVSDAEGTLVSQASKITNLTSSLGTKATSTALDALKTRVSNAEGDITASADKITALQSNVGRFGANALFRMSTEAKPGWSQARIGLVAEATAAGTTHSAGIFLDAKSNGRTHVSIVAEHFSIVSVGDNDALTVPFVVSGGVVYINEAVIKNGDIGTLKIGGNAVTVPTAVSASSQVDLTGSEQTVLTASLVREGARTTIAMSVTVAGYAMSMAVFKLYRIHNGTTTLLRTFFGLSGERGTRNSLAHTVVDTNLGTGSTTYQLRALTQADGNYDDRAVLNDRSMVIDHVKR